MLIYKQVDLISWYHEPESFRPFGKFPDYPESFQAIRKLFGPSGKYPDYPETFQAIRKFSRRSGNFPVQFQGLRAKTFRTRKNFLDCTAAMPWWFLCLWSQPWIVRGWGWLCWWWRKIKGCQRWSSWLLLVQFLFLQRQRQGWGKIATAYNWWEKKRKRERVQFLKCTCKQYW